MPIVLDRWLQPKQNELPTPFTVVLGVGLKEKFTRSCEISCVVCCATRTARTKRGTEHGYSEVAVR